MFFDLWYFLKQDTGQRWMGVTDEHDLQRYRVRFLSFGVLHYVQSFS